MQLLGSLLDRVEAGEEVIITRPRPAFGSCWLTAGLVDCAGRTADVDAFNADVLLYAAVPDHDLSRRVWVLFTPHQSAGG